MEGFIAPKYAKNLERPENIIYISYSQFSGYMKCPQHWKLCYIDKIKKKEATIHTVFGTAMHCVIQEWIKIMYLETVKKSEQYDFDKRLLEEIKAEYKKGLEQNNNVHFSDKEQLSEFYLDGLETLNYLRKKRKTYFDRKNEELIGIELPLYVEINGVCLISFLDLVFRDKITNKIKIRDLKTSTKGWTKWDKDDEVKVAQLILYKIYFAKKYNIPVDDIDVDYVILKRKVQTDLAYPIPRVSVFKPASGKVTQNKVNKMFEGFIAGGFNDGQYNKEKEYDALTGRNEFNCRFCEFNNNEELCPKSKRK